MLAHRIPANLELLSSVHCNFLTYPFRWVSCSNVISPISVGALGCSHRNVGSDNDEGEMKKRDPTPIDSESVIFGCVKKECNGQWAP